MWEAVIGFYNFVWRKLSAEDKSAQRVVQLSGSALVKHVQGEAVGSIPTNPYTQR